MQFPHCSPGPHSDLDQARPGVPRLGRSPCTAPPAGPPRPSMGAYGRRRRSCPSSPRTPARYPRRRRGRRKDTHNRQGPSPRPCRGATPDAGSPGAPTTRRLRGASARSPERRTPHPGRPFAAGRTRPCPSPADVARVAKAGHRVGTQPGRVRPGGVPFSAPDENAVTTPAGRTGPDPNSGSIVEEASAHKATTSVTRTGANGDDPEETKRSTAATLVFGAELSPTPEPAGRGPGERRANRGRTRGAPAPRAVAHPYRSATRHTPEKLPYVIVGGRSRNDFRFGLFPDRGVERLTSGTRRTG